jgi:hypothetical protein
MWVSGHRSNYPHLHEQNLHVLQIWNKYLAIKMVWQI